MGIQNEGLRGHASGPGKAGPPRAVAPTHIPSDGITDQIN
jgi:hypothetical protein